MTVYDWLIAEDYPLRTKLENMIAAQRAGIKRSSRLPMSRGNVAIIPLHGMITQRGSVFDLESGGTSTHGFEAAFQRAVNSDRIGAIVIDVDSPGGTSAGVEQAADRVFAARGTKPIVAVANSQAASAAYWIPSAADTFIAAPGSDVGSIGVFRMHWDYSSALESDGISVEFFAEPARKVEGNPFEPLTDEARTHQLEQVHETYAAFSSAVARHRGVSVSEAREKLGKGRTFHAQSAKQIGLIDRVASMSQVLAELGVGKAGTNAENTRLLVDAWESCEIIEQRKRRVGTERRRITLDDARRKRVT